MTSIFEPLHNFIVSPLVAKLRKEIEDLRTFNKADMIAAGYTLIGKFIGTMPGWNIRCSPRFGLKNPDIAIFQSFQPKAILQFVFEVKPEAPSLLPAKEIEEEIAWLKETVAQRSPAGGNNPCRGYILAAMDYDQKWFVPTTQEKQNVFILPINCHDIPLHNSWRQKWDDSKRKLF
jgi:hypothetical protein